MSKNKFKTQYKDLLSIEKRLDELSMQECKRNLSKNEKIEWDNLLKSARKLRPKQKKESLLEIRKNKLDKILMGV